MMEKKIYEAPRISLYAIEPQAILAGSGSEQHSGFTYGKGVTSGDDDDAWDD